jgi:16S rRNA (uracil1498-N3)-methyltransferase
LRAHAIEAAEQSERLSVPELRSPEPLGQVLTVWRGERRLLVCDESGAGEPLGEAAARLHASEVALLVGPEGGFDQTELDALGKLSFVSRVGLGPRVLRAETAALAALAIYQATAGDWRLTRSR